MNDSALIVVLLLWGFIGGLIGALIGQYKGRVAAGFWFGFFLGFIGWILVALGPDLRRGPPAVAPSVDPDLADYIEKKGKAAKRPPNGSIAEDPWAEKEG